MAKELSRLRQSAAKTIYAAMQILVEKGGEAFGREVIEEIEKRVELDTWEKAVYEKSGICHASSSPHYELIKNFAPFKTLDECF